MAKYDIDVELIGHDGNAFAILGKVKSEMRRAGVEKSSIDEYIKDATSGDYHHLLATTSEWVNVI